MLYLGFIVLLRSIVRSAGFARRWDNLDVIRLKNEDTIISNLVSILVRLLQ